MIFRFIVLLQPRLLAPCDNLPSGFNKKIFGMDTRLMFMVAVLLRCSFVGAQAMPDVVLISNVDTIKTNLTQTLMLKLTFDAASVPDTVFQSIVSIVIKREDNDEEVATLTPVGSVTYNSPHEAKVFNAFKDGSANGKITGKKGFLEVMARYPNITHTGKFLAVVKTLNIVGDTKDYTASKTVSQANATIADIVQGYKDIIKEIKDIKEKESRKVWFSAFRFNKNWDFNGWQNFYEEVSSGTDIVFNVAHVNQGDGYDPNTGVFTAPVAGTYYFKYDLQVQPVNGKTHSAVQIVKNGNPAIRSFMQDKDAKSGAMGVLGGSIVTPLYQGDKVSVQTFWDSRFCWVHQKLNEDGSRAEDGFTAPSLFMGFLLK